MKRTFLLTTALLFLFAVEILRVYFIMPFPGSQRANTISLAYFIGKYTWSLRILGLMLLIPFAWYAYKYVRMWKKIILSLFIVLYGIVFYFFNFKFLADKMFYQPKEKLLLPVAESKIDTSRLIIGVQINDQAKAYPIEIIGYHHQVQDTVGGEPVMITYCTVCRTGRVFSPFVKGKYQHFRLVGMDHFNAMFEDEDTKSWWRQATGVAVAGPLKGTALKELPSEQMRLGAWVRKFPNTLVMQPDPSFVKQYEGLQGFDNGTINSGLEKRDSTSWKFKSWVVGVLVNDHAKAYDWNELLKKRMIKDTLQNVHIILVVEKDNASFHVWKEMVNDKLLQLAFDEASQTLKDAATNTVWDMNGQCIEGTLKGSHLSPIPAYQEFWHSWQSFHPATTTMQK